MSDTPQAQTQADRPARLTLRGFLDSVQREVFDADRGLLGTWLQLWRWPGATVRRYVEWRDPRLTPPVRYAIVCLALSTLLLHWFDLGADFKTGFQKGFLEADQDPTRNQALGDLIGQHLDWWLYLVAIPSMAAALEGVYRARINWAEAFAFATYSLAQLSLGISLLIVLLSHGFGYVGAAPLLLWPIYFGVACFGYSRTEGLGLWSALRATVLMLAYVLLFSLALAFVTLALVGLFG